MSNGMLAAGRVIVREAKRRVVRGATRELLKSITVARGTRPGAARVGFKKPTSRRAHFTEFGTRHHAAEPFMRPAVTAAAAAAIAKAGETIMRGIDREVAKLRGGG